MKITDIEVIPIAPKLATRYATRRVDLYGIDCRIVYKVHTDAGITGYGDTRVRPHAIPAKVPSVLRARFDCTGSLLPLTKYPNTIARQVLLI